MTNRLVFDDSFVTFRADCNVNFLLSSPRRSHPTRLTNARAAPSPDSEYPRLSISQSLSSHKTKESSNGNAPLYRQRANDTFLPNAWQTPAPGMEPASEI